MPEIKERPILFNGAMVRAILEGRKTVTRRIVKHQPDAPVTDAIPKRDFPHGPPTINWYWRPRHGHLNGVPSHGWDFKCPFGQPGDRLWVRENWMDLRGTGVEHRPTPDSPLQRYAYGADSRPGSYSDEARKDFGLKWRPSIHMPRVACRILLEVTDVRVERLQAITYEQAAAEGVQRDHRMWFATDEGGQAFKYPEQAFAQLWRQTGGDWDANPWVWVVEFERVDPPHGV
jgi:hypothetical protein